MKQHSRSNTNKKRRLTINKQSYELAVDENMPLLWVLRDELGLVGTKYGCGAGLCGACSVLIDGVATRSCLINVGRVHGEITTIEGLGNSESLHGLQEAWIETQVAQCGYCQPGQIISAYTLLAKNSAPTDQEIKEAMTGNLCRCGTYARIHKAIKSAKENLGTTVQVEENS